MNKKYLIILVILLILILAGGSYYYWKTKMEKPTTSTNTLNPMKSVQNANPYDKTNPFSNMKVNPFE